MAREKETVEGGGWDRETAARFLVKGASPSSRVPANYEADTAESSPRYLHAAKLLSPGAVPRFSESSFGEGRPSRWREDGERSSDDECDESSKEFSILREYPLLLLPFENFLLSIEGESFIARTRGTTSRTVVSTPEESRDCRDAANVYRVFVILEIVKCILEDF